MTLALDLTVAAPAPWRRRAACGGYPVAWWFSDHARPVAAAICAGCGVQSECDADADVHGDEGMRAQRVHVAAEVPCDGCGEPLGVVELAAGDTCCGPRCAEVAEAAAFDRLGHGTVRCYNAGCHCGLCRGAVARSKRASRARRNNTTSDDGPAYGAGPERGEQ